eukprot:1732350-Rhodomonas_salina.4
MERWKRTRDTETRPRWSSRSRVEAMVVRRTPAAPACCVRSLSAIAWSEESVGVGQRRMRM